MRWRRLLGYLRGIGWALRGENWMSGRLSGWDAGYDAAEAVWTRCKMEGRNERVVPTLSETCSGIAATWCPIHGDCTCRQRLKATGVDARMWQRETCPLHGTTSTHPDGLDWD